MKKKFPDILNGLRNGRDAERGYSLSASERADMKRVIREYAELKPLRGASTYSVSVSYRWYSFAGRPTLAAFALVVIFGSSLSYAAEGALPGDALYAMKTYINEPTRLALATDAEAKAVVQIELAERRIDEAAALAVEGKLDADTQEKLTVAFESHAAAASDNIEKADIEDSSAAVELASRFETRLAAHDEILAEVEVEEEADAPKERRLAIAIRGAGAVVASIRARAEEKAAVSSNVVATALSLSAKATPEVSTMMAVDTGASAEVASVTHSAAERMRKAAEKRFSEMKKKAKSSSRLNAEVRADADAQLEMADDLIDIGKEQLEDGAVALAFHSFQESLILTEKLGVTLKAAPTLAKAQSRRNAANRDENRNVRMTDEESGAHATATSEAAATLQITTPEPVEITVETSAEADLDIKVEDVIPPTIRIFPVSDEREEDEEDAIELDISL